MIDFLYTTGICCSSQSGLMIRSGGPHSLMVLIQNQESHMYQNPYTIIT